MGKRKELAGVRIDIYSVRDALRKIDHYISHDSLNVVEMINMKTIVEAGEDDEVRSILEQIDMVLPSNREILAEIGESLEQRLKEADDYHLVDEFIKKLCKSRKSLYLLTETEEQKSYLETYMKENFDGRLLMEGSGSFEEMSYEDENIVNAINAVSPCVIFAVLSTPREEHFLYRHKQMLNARLWFGIGVENAPLLPQKKTVEFFRRRHIRYKMKQQIQSYDTESGRDETDL